MLGNAWSVNRLGQRKKTYLRAHMTDPHNFPTVRRRRQFRRVDVDAAKRRRHKRAADQAAELLDRDEPRNRGRDESEEK